jgi:hypothetical protein
MNVISEPLREEQGVNEINEEAKSNQCGQKQFDIHIVSPS